MTVGAMKIDPITEERPKLSDVARGVNQVHACFEDHRATTKREISAVRVQAKAAASSAAKANAGVLELKQAMGLEEGQKKVAGLSSQRASFVRTALATTSAIAAVSVVYKTFMILWPALLTLAHSIANAAHRGMLP